MGASFGDLAGSDDSINLPGQNLVNLNENHSAECSVTELAGGRQRVTCSVSPNLENLGVEGPDWYGTGNRCGFGIEAAITGTSFSGGVDVMFCSHATYDPSLRNNGPRTNGCYGKQ